MFECQFLNDFYIGSWHLYLYYTMLMFEWALPTNMYYYTLPLNLNPLRTENTKLKECLGYQHVPTLQLNFEPETLKNNT